MSMSALESVEDAFDATRRLLLPFDRGTWFRLAAVMLFVVGGGFGFSWVFNLASLPGDTSQPPGDGGPQPEPAPGGPDPGALTPELTPTLIVFLLLFALFLVALFVLWNVAGATMEFAFVEALGAEDVRLGEFFRSNLRPGVRLFVFRTGLSLVTLGGLFGVLFALGVLVGGLPVSGWSDATLFALLLLAIPLFLVVFVALGLVLGLTTTFVVPVMLAEDRGVFSAWRRFLDVLVAEWKEYLVYLLVNWVLGIVIGLVTGMLTLGVVIVLGIPALLVTIPVLFAGGTNAIGGTILLVVWLVVFVLFFVAMLVIAVPFQTFRRYYALLVLGDTDADLDVVPATRAAVRADGGDWGTDDGRDGSDGPPSNGEGDGGDASGGPGGPGGADAGGTVTGGTDDGGPTGRDEGTGDAGDDRWNVDR